MCALETLVLAGFRSSEDRGGSRVLRVSLPEGSCDLKIKKKSEVLSSLARKEGRIVGGCTLTCGMQSDRRQISQSILLK
jgi:hypothetical protein